MDTTATSTHVSRDGLTEAKKEKKPLQRSNECKTVRRALNHQCAPICLAAAATTLKSWCMMGIILRDFTNTNSDGLQLQQYAPNQRKTSKAPT
jgi:hypothetical protein